MASDSAQAGRVASKFNKSGGRSSGWVLLLAAVTAATIASVGLSGYTLALYRAKLATEPTSESPSVHFVLDTSLLADCPNAGVPVEVSQLPCMKSETLYYTKNGALGPIKCLDEIPSSIPQAGPGRCSEHAKVFNVSRETGEVVVLKDGVYRIYAQISYYDAEQSPSVAALQVHSSHKHSWVQCHQSISGRSLSNYCVINSDRRFGSGNRVSVGIPEAFRTIDAANSVTFWGIVRISD